MGKLSAIGKAAETAFRLQRKHWRKSASAMDSYPKHLRSLKEFKNVGARKVARDERLVKRDKLRNRLYIKRAAGVGAALTALVVSAYNNAKGDTITTRKKRKPEVKKDGKLRRKKQR